MIKYDCGCEYENESQVVAKILFKGIMEVPLPENFNLTCACGSDIDMDTHLYTCSDCGQVFGVTPCNNADITKVVSIPKDVYNTLVD